MHADTLNRHKYTKMVSHNADNVGMPNLSLLRISEMVSYQAYHPFATASTQLSLHRHLNHLNLVIIFYLQPKSVGTGYQYHSTVYLPRNYLAPGSNGRPATTMRGGAMAGAAGPLPDARLGGRVAWKARSHAAPRY